MPILPIHYRRLLQLVLLLMLVMLSTSALADTAAHGQLVSTVVDLFKADNPWVKKVQGAAGELFWSLALISVVWNFGSLLMRRADFGEFFFEILSFILFTGLFYWFLTNTFDGDNLVYAIVDSFKKMGPDGVGDLRKPADNIVQIGLNIFYQVLEQSANWHDGDLLLVGGMTLMIVVALTMVVAQIVLVLIMAWMLAYGGIFLLGFGGSRWTSLIVVSYLKHVVAVGVALFALILLVNVGQDLLEMLSADLVGGDAVKYSLLADMLVVSLIMMVLAYKVPSLLYTLVTSSPLGLLAGSASMTGNAIAAGSMAVYNTAYNTAAQAISHYRSSETHYRQRDEEPASIRTQHASVIDALRSAAGAQAGVDAVYQPVNVGGQTSFRGGDKTSSEEEGSVFGSSYAQGAWPGDRAQANSPVLQAASQQAASQQAASQQAASQSAASQNTASQQAAWQQAASQNLASQHAASMNAASQGAASQNSASLHAASQHAASQQAASERTATQGDTLQQLQAASRHAASQHMSYEKGDHVSKNSEKSSGGMDAISRSSTFVSGTAPGLQERMSGGSAAKDRIGRPAAHSSSVFANTPASMITSGGTASSMAQSTSTSHSTSSSSGGFQPPVVNANVSGTPSSGMSSPSLLGGSGASGSVGDAVSKSTVGLQEGPSLGAAPRQPSNKPRGGRKIDDTTGPVGRRDKQQERALKQQEKTARGELRRDENKDQDVNTKPVPPADGKPSSPTDDEVNAFRERRPDASKDIGDTED